VKHIRIERGENIIITTWLCAVISREYRAVVTSVLKAVKKSRVDCWLIDANRLSTPALQDQN
jgi:hypothetical protein